MDSIQAKIRSFKRELSRVFDDDLHTKQWHNYVDYAIIGLISRILRCASMKSLIADTIRAKDALKAI